MSETPASRDPRQDEDPPGTPAVPGDYPWLGSPGWRLVPQSPDWPEWLDDDALAGDEEPGDLEEHDDPEEYDDPDNAPPADLARVRRAGAGRGAGPRGGGRRGSNWLSAAARMYD